MQARNRLENMVAPSLCERVYVTAATGRDGTRRGDSSALGEPHHRHNCAACCKRVGSQAAADTSAPQHLWPAAPAFDDGALHDSSSCSHAEQLLSCTSTRHTDLAHDLPLVCEGVTGLLYCCLFDACRLQVVHQPLHTKGAVVCLDEVEHSCFCCCSHVWCWLALLVVLWDCICCWSGRLRTG